MALSALCFFTLSPTSHEQERERERECLDADVGEEAKDAVGVGVGADNVDFEFVSLRKDCRLSERRLRSTLPRSGNASGAFKWQLTSRQQLNMFVVGSIPLQHNGEGELQLSDADADANADVTAESEVAERLRK